MNSTAMNSTAMNAAMSGAVTSGNTMLVVANHGDGVAADVAALLRADAFEVVVTTPSALCGGAVTYLSEHGATTWASTVAGTAGTGPVTVTSTELGAVLNRSRHLDPAGFADEDDESYAMCERAALFAAMVESLRCPVVNRSQGTTLSGPPHLEAEWMATAVHCGLTVRSMTWTSDGIDLEPVVRDLGAATVVGPHVVPTRSTAHATEWSRHHATPVIALAGALGCELVRLSLGETVDGRCVVTHIDPTPAQVEPEVIEHLVRHLTADLASAERGVASPPSPLRFAS